MGSRRRFKGGRGGASQSSAESFKVQFRTKLVAWINAPETLASLDEVPGISFETWLVDYYLLRMPPTLSAKQRKDIHQLADELGLTTQSLGEGAERHILVSRDPELLAIMTTNNSETSNASAVPLAQRSRWYDASVQKPRVQHHYFLAGPFALSAEGALLREMKAHSGIHQKTRVRVRAQVVAPSFADLEPGDVVLVNTPQGLLSMVRYLLLAPEVAFDCEFHHYRSYHGITCLLQLNGGGKNYVVDTLALWECIGPTLGPLFSEPSIVKIGHSMLNDVPALHRDFGIIVVNGFDTQLAAHAAGLGKGLGLVRMLGLLGCPALDEHSRAKDLMSDTDWRLRPLTPSMLVYAASDVHYLIDAFHSLRDKLLLELAVEKGSPSLFASSRGLDNDSTALEPESGGEGEGEGEVEEDEESLFRYVDSPLPPPFSSSNTRAEPLGVGDKSGADSWGQQGWSDVLSPMLASGISPVTGMSGPQLCSPASAVTEAEDLSDKYSDDDDGDELSILERTCAVGPGGAKDSTVKALSMDAALSTQTPTATRSSAVAVAQLQAVEAQELVSDPQFGRLYRLLKSTTLVASKRLWAPKAYNPSDAFKEKDFTRNVKGKDNCTVLVYQRLHHWRDQEARRLDESKHYVSSIEDLFLLADAKPESNDQLLALWEGSKGPPPPRVVDELLALKAKAQAEQPLRAALGLPLRYDDFSVVQAVKEALQAWRTAELERERECEREMEREREHERQREQEQEQELDELEEDQEQWHDGEEMPPELESEPAPQAEIQLPLSSSSALHGPQLELASEQTMPRAPLTSSSHVREGWEDREREGEREGERVDEPESRPRQGAAAFAAFGAAAVLFVFSSPLMRFLQQYE